MAKKNIFVVEDEEDILDLIRHNLAKEGFAVSTATDGQEAVKAMLRRPPDLVLLDLMLPGLDGLEVCRRLKKEPKTAAIPVLMVTAKDDESDVVTGLELGADDYIVKPFRMKELVARVRTALRRQRPAALDKEAPVRAGILQNPGRFDALMQVMHIARHLERIADHATNIAEDLIYLAEGRIVRHTAEVASAPVAEPDQR